LLGLRSTTVAHSLFNPLGQYVETIWRLIALTGILVRHTYGLMCVSMMYIWIVVMPMHHSFMTMWMAVGLAQRRPIIMLVMMVFVMNVSMFMFERVMPMLVRVSLG